MFPSSPVRKLPFPSPAVVLSGPAATQQPGLAAGVVSTPLDRNTTDPLLSAINTMIAGNLRAVVLVFIKEIQPLFDDSVEQKLATVEYSLVKRLREEVLQQDRDGRSSSPILTR